MKITRKSLFRSVLAVLLALATLPAIADVKPHQKIPAGKECSSCHKKAVAEWKASPHGKNDVQCTVCHGTVVEKMTTKPTLAVCGQCHTEHALGMAGSAQGK